MHYFYLERFCIYRGLEPRKVLGMQVCCKHHLHVGLGLWLQVEFELHMDLQGGEILELWLGLDFIIGSESIVS